MIFRSKKRKIDLQIQIPPTRETIVVRDHWDNRVSAKVLHYEIEALRSLLDQAEQRSRDIDREFGVYKERIRKLLNDV